MHAQPDNFGMGVPRFLLCVCQERENCEGISPHGLSGASRAGEYLHILVRGIIRTAAVLRWTVELTREKGKIRGNDKSARAPAASLTNIWEVFPSVGRFPVHSKIYIPQVYRTYIDRHHGLH